MKNRKSYLKIILIFSFLLGIISSANSEGFWCGNKLINIGDTRMEVINKCGPPDDSEIVSYETTGTMFDSRVVSYSTKKVEKLYYNCGYGRFIQILTFIDGKLANIENGGYGSGPSRCE